MAPVTPTFLVTAGAPPPQNFDCGAIAPVAPAKSAPMIITQPITNVYNTLYSEVEKLSASVVSLQNYRKTNPVSAETAIALQSRELSL